MFIKLFGLLLTAVVLTGCGAMGAPKNAEEFRQASQKGPLKRTDTFEVARPLGDISATLRNKAAECLNVAIRWNNTRGGSGVVKYKPTFATEKGRASLYVQSKREGGNHTAFGEPPDGAIRVLIDATAVSGSRTRIDLYLWSPFDDKRLGKAFSGWAKGDDLSCPDL